MGLSTAAKTTTITLNNQSATTAGTTKVTATYDKAMQSITIPTKTGYTFDGYYTGKNGSGTMYYTASGISTRAWDQSAGAVTLYARWTAMTTLSIEQALDKFGADYYNIVASVQETEAAILRAISNGATTTAEILSDPNVKAAWAATGALLGGLGGSYIGGTAGAALGTIALPGGGTIALGGVGAAVGSAAGVTIGAGLTILIENTLESVNSWTASATANLANTCDRNAQNNRDKADQLKSSGGNKVTSPNQMQKQIEQGKAPKGVERVDNGNTSVGSQPHIHFGDDYKSLNQDGTWGHDGKTTPTLTKEIIQWLKGNGWGIPAGY